jgi:hypothetical protein
LNVYVELKDGQDSTSREISNLIHEEVTKLDTPYAELEAFTGLRPIKVTLLAKNAFLAYRLRQQAAGAELEQLRPPHVNPCDEILNFLLDSAAQRAVLETPVGEEEKVEA